MQEVAPLETEGCVGTQRRQRLKIRRQTSDWVGTNLASLGVAFRFFNLPVKRMHRLWAGQGSPAHFLFAFGGPDGASLGRLEFVPPVAQASQPRAAHQG